MDGELLSLFHHAHSSSLVEALESLLESDAFVDCVLAAEGKSLKAHKVILSASSPYFQMLFSQESDKLPILFLKDVQYEYLKLIIDFIYCGQVKISDTQLNTFLEVARSLQIKGLDSRSSDTGSARANSHEPLVKSKEEKSQTSKKVITEEKGEEDSDCRILDIIDVIDVEEKIDDTEPAHQQGEKQANLIEELLTCTIQSTYSLAPGEILPTPDLLHDPMDAESNTTDAEAEEESNKLDGESNILDAESICSHSPAQAATSASVISPIEKSETLSDMYEETGKTLHEDLVSDDDINEPVSDVNQNVPSPSKEGSSSPAFEDAVEVVPEDLPEQNLDQAPGSYMLDRAASFRRLAAQAMLPYPEECDSSRVASPKLVTGTKIACCRQNKKACSEREITTSCKRVPERVVQLSPRDSNCRRTTSLEPIAEKKIVLSLQTQRPYLGLETAACCRKIPKRVMQRCPGNSDGQRVAKPVTVTVKKCVSCCRNEKPCPRLERAASCRRIPGRVMQPCSGDTDGHRITSPEPITEKKIVLCHETEYPYLELETVRCRRIPERDMQPCPGDSTGRRVTKRETVTKRKLVSCHQIEKPCEKLERTASCRRISGKVMQGTLKPHPRNSDSRRITSPKQDSEEKIAPIPRSKKHCPVCLKTIITPGYMKLHMRIHTGEKPHNCPQCQKSFRVLQHMRRHMLTHTGEKPYCCPKCHKSFAQVGHLKTHELIHLGSRGFTCGVCKRSFIQRVHLKNHMLVHTGERPNRCPECPKAFNRPSSLKRHLSIHSKRI